MLETPPQTRTVRTCTWALLRLSRGATLMHTRSRGTHGTDALNAPIEATVNACMHDRCMDAPAYAAASACDDLLLASSKHAVSREAVTVLACAKSCMCMHGGRVMPLLRASRVCSFVLPGPPMAPSCSLKGRPHGSCFATTKGYLHYFL